jgi:hypothetical protein
MNRPSTPQVGGVFPAVKTAAFFLVHTCIFSAFSATYYFRFSERQ